MNSTLVPIIEGPKLRCVNDIVTQHLIRREVRDKLELSARLLPDGMSLLVYEAYRPKSRQVVLWERTRQKVTALYPDAAEDEIVERTALWTANPYTTGSGHQAGAAIDVSIGYEGAPLAMGTAVHEFTEWTRFDAPTLTASYRRNRGLLKMVMEASGLVNYPDEWWHYSYGDRLWAELTGRTSEAVLFHPLMDD